MLGDKKGFQLIMESDVQKKLAEDEAAYQSLLEVAEEPALMRHIRNAWETNRRHKINVTNRLLYCLRSRKGEYSPGQMQELVNQGGSEPVYLKLTGTKSRAAEAWIRDTMMPTGDEKCFSLRPTSIPDLPTKIDIQVRESARQEAIGMIQAGALPPNVEEVVGFFEKVRDKALKQLSKEAIERTRRMEQKIADLMDEGDWNVAFEEFIADFVTYPTAFIKGPYIKKKRVLTWDKNNQPVVADQILLGWKNVRPWDIYPAPYARSLQDQNLIEHIRFDNDSLYKLIGVPGYSEDEIRAALNDYSIGGLKDWMWEDFERNQLESDSPFLTQDGTVIDGLHFWGNVSGKMLKEWGMNDSLDDDRQYPVDAILIGNHIIRAEINEDPTGIRPYHYACWDAVPGSIWGIALPEQMDDHQSIVNGAARALMNNMSLGSGPQVMVITDMLAEGENIRSMHPFKIWQGKLNVMNTNSSLKPIDFFQPRSMVNDLMTVLEKFEQKTDDVTNVPRYSYGNERIGGAGSTASGLSMLMNSAAKGIRRAIASIDSKIIRPMIQQAFTFVMLHDPDESLKGDCKVVPRGAASLLVKEQNLVRLQTFLQQTANPIDAGIIGMRGRANLLREVGRLMDLPVEDIVPSDDELEMMMQQQQEAAQQAAITGAGGDSRANMVEGAGNDSQMQQNKLNKGIA